MSFSTGAALLDAIVLAAVAREERGTYGYRITHEVCGALELSESTLYPVLRRLQKDGSLSVYDEAFNGRNRRYYQITAQGRERLEAARAEWRAYADTVDTLFRETPCPAGSREEENL